MAILSLACLLIVVTYARAQTFGQAEVVYTWNRLEYDWPSESEKNEFINNGTYVPGRDLLAGIKLYRGDVYVTMPRWRWPDGIPVVLAKVIKKDNKNILQPYPNWAAQRQGDCSALQYVQSMEIDPNTGRMYVIDTGRVGNVLNLCPPKIVVYDLILNREVDKYEFPEDVVDRKNCFLNDIVLDYVRGRVRYAYISNTFESSMVVYDFKTRSSYKLVHPSMGVESDSAANISIHGVIYTFPMPINGMAMSPDFKYVYFSSLAGYNLNQIPTSTLRNRNGTAGIRVVGKKTSQTDGLAHGKKRLYYGAIGLSAVYFWDYEKDLADQKTTMDKVTMTTQTLLRGDNQTMEWPDTFAFDEEGWLWVVTSRLQIYWGLDVLPEAGDPFLRIWKIYVNERSYLSQDNSTIGAGNQGGNGAGNQGGNGAGNQGGNGASTLLVLNAEARTGLLLALLASLIALIASRKQ